MDILPENSELIDKTSEPTEKSNILTLTTNQYIVLFGVIILFLLAFLNTVCSHTPKSLLFKLKRKRKLIV